MVSLQRNTTLDVGGDVEVAGIPYCILATADVAPPHQEFPQFWLKVSKHVVLPIFQMFQCLWGIYALIKRGWMGNSGT